MYSARINGQPTTFGTSGLLYRSNKLMYDRATRSLWRQFTGEPVIGPLADSDIKLPFFPVLLTTWQEWRTEHPDTTVLSIDTGFYPAEVYASESDPDSAYYDYFNSPDTMFPVWIRDSALETKEVVLGLGIADDYKAYPVKALQRERVVNDELGGAKIVVIASSTSQAARVYEREQRSFALSDGGSTTVGLPMELVDSQGATWRVEEEFLVNAADPTQRLKRLPTHMSFWFGWFQFHPDTKVYGQDGN